MPLLINNFIISQLSICIVMNNGSLSKGSNSHLQKMIGWLGYSSTLHTLYCTFLLSCACLFLEFEMSLNRLHPLCMVWTILMFLFASSGWALIDGGSFCTLAISLDGMFLLSLTRSSFTRSIKWCHSKYREWLGHLIEWWISNNVKVDSYYQAWTCLSQGYSW